VIHACPIHIIMRPKKHAHTACESYGDSSASHATPPGMPTYHVVLVAVVDDAHVGIGRPDQDGGQFLQYALLQIIEITIDRISQDRIVKIAVRTIISAA